MTFIVHSDSADGLIPSVVRGRVLVPAGQREALLDAFERSGQSGVAFCRQHGLKYPTFATWVQKRKKLSPVEGHREPVRGCGFAEILLDPPSPAPRLAPAPDSLTVTLPDGIRIDIACRSQLPWAAELVHHLSSNRSC